MGRSFSRHSSKSQADSRPNPGYQASGLPDLWDSVQNENVGLLVQMIKNFKTAMAEH